MRQNPPSFQPKLHDVFNEFKIAVLGKVENSIFKKNCLILHPKAVTSIMNQIFLFHKKRFCEKDVMLVHFQEKKHSDSEIPL